MRRVVVGIAASAILLVGCGSAGEPKPTDEQQIGGPESVLEEAEAGGASQDQLEVISTGPEITFTDYEQAVSRSVSCMKDAGIDVIGSDVRDYRGFPEIRYSFAAASEGRSDEETREVADACMNTHSRWIEMLYQTSPSSIEAVEARFAPYREALVGCLEEQGAELEGDLIRDELVTLSYDTLERTGVDCVQTVGVPQ